MDPNKTLEQIRDLIEELNKRKWRDDNITEQLCWSVDGLDCWLTSGGFLPDAWKGQDK